MHVDYSFEDPLGACSGTPARIATPGPGARRRPALEASCPAKEEVTGSTIPSNDPATLRLIIDYLVSRPTVEKV
jgi:hypothetical protein